MTNAHSPWPLALAFVMAAACGGGTVGAPGDGGPQGDGQSFPDTVIPVDSKGPACTKNEDCNGGVCLEGNCCASAKQVCGKLCCPSGKTCFANACVTPGNLCYSNGDCAPGEYCEPTLGPGGSGSSDGGVGDGGASPDAGSGQVCLQPPPRAGRCLELPERCGTPPTPGCLPVCEFKPTVGKLNAKQEWFWGAGSVKTYKDYVDVWSTPAVGRLTDTNCDGKVNELDPPNIVFIAGNAKTSQCAAVAPACLTGVLRVLDGASGQELWSLRKPGPGTTGFSAVSLALGDVNRDGHLEIVTVDSLARVVLISHTGKLLATSNKAIPEAIKGDGTVNTGFGWGGGLALADMNGDGQVEVAYGRSIFTINATGTKITYIGSGTHGAAVGSTRALSVFSDLDGDGKQELIGGNTAYTYDGKKIGELWYTSTVGDGYPAVADFDGDKKPEVALLISTGADKGKLAILDGKTGKVLAGPFLAPGTGNGGPPTVADFDGDGRPEVGVAKANFYSVTKVNLKATSAANKLKLLWKQINHDFSSSVTGSTVFDFEGDGAAEVIYNDECFIWVYDGKTGDVKFAHPTTSFTATESSLVADVDGDGRAEMVMMANRANPSSWKCNIAPWTSPDPKLNRPAWAPPKGQAAWSGITVFGDKANSWVGTRTLWNQHSYHVSNICDSRDSACHTNENQYGVIPKLEKTNYTVTWLNNFRQNVQDKGIFDAPDATISLRVDCGIEGSSGSMTLRGTLRNLGLALLPAGVKVGFYVVETGGERLLAEKTTTSPLFPGQAVELLYNTKSADNVTAKSQFVAKIITDPQNPTFNECRTDNNTSELAKNPCVLQ